MIRRIYSTFIDCPVSYPDFFQPTSSSPPTAAHHFRKFFPIENFSFLFDVAPCFRLNSKNIRIINDPSEFYRSILSNASSAKHRISLASLYLGIGKLENDLVKAIENNLAENDTLKVNILLDYTRGTRGEMNSKVMLMSLLKQSANCRLSLYHTPKLRGLTKKLVPARWNELVGLQHMKIYLFDETVIISGANLSNDYFTNRQDRYIEIKDKRLSDFFTNVLDRVHEFSLKVDRSGDVGLHDNWKLLPYESDYHDYAMEARKSIQNYFMKVFNEQSSSELHDENDDDTWLFPTLEMGQINIHHDSIITKKILGASGKGSALKMATGYFNLTQNYMDTLVNECEADCSIIMAHPNANGFKDSKGPSGGIPDAYSLIARKFYEQIKQYGHENRISLLEYEREKWTYHAKGLWYHHNRSDLPCMTIIGSSNYGERSVNRDLEAQICLVTTNKSLQKSLKAEYDHLLSYASTAEDQLTTRLIPTWVKTVVFLFKKFF